MKKLLKITFALFAIFLISACSSSGPQDVAEKFIKAVYTDQDFDAAAEYGTESTAAMLAMAKSFAKEEDKGKTFKIINTEIDEDKAVCTYTIDEDESENKLDLIKVDGDWKVEMKK